MVTDTHTDTWKDYRNPPGACVPRFNDSARDTKDPIASTNEDKAELEELEIVLEDDC